MPLPPMWELVKQNTINLIKTVAEFIEIRNSLGASLLMTCMEMKLWQGQRGWKRQEWWRKEGRRWKRSGLVWKKTFPRMARRIVARQLDWLVPSVSQRTKHHSYDDTVSYFFILFPSLQFFLLASFLAVWYHSPHTAGTSRFQVKALAFSHWSLAIQGHAKMGSLQRFANAKPESAKG